MGKKPNPMMLAAARRRVAQRIIEKGEVPIMGNKAVFQYVELYGLDKPKCKISKYLLAEYENPNSLIYRATEGTEKRKPDNGYIERRAKYLEYINSAEWKSFRNSIIAKRGRKCELCGETQGEIHAHHLTYARFMNELETDIQLLCKPCHMKVHNKKERKKKSNSLSAKVAKKKQERKRKSKNPIKIKISTNAQKRWDALRREGKI